MDRCCVMGRTGRVLLVGEGLQLARWPTRPGTSHVFISMTRFLTYSSQDDSQITSHVLLLSDTQVPHPALQTGRESWAARLRAFLFTLTLKKSWHAASKFKPDVVVFLGDMLANGRGAKDETKYAQLTVSYLKTNR